MVVEVGDEQGTAAVDWADVMVRRRRGVVDRAVLQLRNRLVSNGFRGDGGAGGDAAVARLQGGRSRWQLAALGCYFRFTAAVLLPYICITNGCIFGLPKKFGANFTNRVAAGSPFLAQNALNKWLCPTIGQLLEML